MAFSDVSMCFFTSSQEHSRIFHFQGQQLLSSHASAEVRAENTLERKFASWSFPTFFQLHHGGQVHLSMLCQHCAQSSFQATSCFLIHTISILNYAHPESCDNPGEKKQPFQNGMIQRPCRVLKE